VDLATTKKHSKKIRKVINKKTPEKQQQQPTNKQTEKRAGLWYGWITGSPSGVVHDTGSPVNEIKRAVSDNHD
jgi:hypothetical protein